MFARRHLDSPWGLVVAPSSFGRFAGDLLVGNFGDGRINAFEMEKNGRFVCDVLRGWEPPCDPQAVTGGIAALAKEYRCREVRGDAYALPFASGSLDLVTTTVAYHWLLDPAAALAEMRRVLVPGGGLVLGTLVSYLGSRRYLGMRVVTVRQHEQDLAAAGFVVEGHAPVGHRVVVFAARAGG